MNKPDTDLKDFGRRMPFTVPDGYFDSLSRQILDAADSEAAIEKPRRRFARLMPKLAVAASVAAVVAVVLTVVLRAPSVTLDDVEAVYSSLSSEDQELMDFDYNDDIFLALTE